MVAVRAALISLSATFFNYVSLRIAQSVLAYCGTFGSAEHYDAIADYLQYHVVEGKSSRNAFCLAYEDRAALLHQCSAVLLSARGEADVLTTESLGAASNLPTMLWDGVHVGQTRPLNGYSTHFFSTSVVLMS